MSIVVTAVGRSDVPALSFSSRFRADVAYLITPADAPGAPTLAPGEFYVARGDAQRHLDAGVVEVVSPLSSQRTAEIELSEEQEQFLEWLLQHGVEHVALRTA